MRVLFSFSLSYSTGFLVSSSELPIWRFLKTKRRSMSSSFSFHR
ncbi:hypothetical protein Patl1_01863 [Pistacia atlantica]|uniref:Uncharacterized protein n=1 Tax=Pistacia atlantica TaxID=434234 RepID=A0ACC1C4H8_9ROSI|nr:hypothetical protein Patl1_01863 [Pistacia atlantica]